MYRLFRFILGFFLGLIGEAIGYWIIAKYHIHGTFNLFMIIVVAFIFVYLAFLLYGLYMVYVSKDMRDNGAVADYLKRLKSPYFVALRHYVNGEFQQAKDFVSKIRKQDAKAQMSTLLLLEEDNLEEARIVISTIRLKSTRNVLYAQLASKERNWSEFEIYMNEVRKDCLKYALEADAAFRKGKHDEAKQFGDLAIASTRGLQRFIFVKSLERQEKNPNRDSYF